MKNKRSLAALVSLTLALSSVGGTLVVSAEDNSAAAAMTIEDMIQKLSDENEQYDFRVTKLGINADGVEIRTASDGSLLVENDVTYTVLETAWNDELATLEEDHESTRYAFKKYSIMDIHGNKLHDDYYVPIRDAYYGGQTLVDRPYFDEDHNVCLTNGSSSYYFPYSIYADMYKFIDEENNTFDHEGWEKYKNSEDFKGDLFLLTPVFSDIEGNILFDDSYIGAMRMCNGIGVVMKNDAFGIPEDKIVPSDFFDFYDYYDLDIDDNDDIIQTINEAKKARYDEIMAGYKCMLIDSEGKTVLELPKIFSYSPHAGKYSSPLAWISNFYQDDVIPFYSQIKVGDTVFDNALEGLDDYTSVDELIAENTCWNITDENGQLGHAYGYMDLEGNIVIPQKYDYAGSFLRGYAFVGMEKQYSGMCYGVIDKTGEMVVPAEYSNIYTPIDGYVTVGKWIETWHEDSEYEEGGYSTSVRKFGMIDLENNEVIPLEYEDADWAVKGYLPCKKDGKWGMVNSKNEEVIPFAFDDVTSFTSTATGGRVYAIQNREVYAIDIIDKSIVVGDLNGDGDVNVTDLSSIAAHVKGVRPLKEEALEKADLNGDGDVNVTDLSKLAAHVKGIRSLTSEN
ncbi:WG repeat-containing protein [Ruminococcus sp.]|uniref:WG repeat-containing protein n=1 Tax=Ruminococcus sp. TaxID=41978 RepID=UPI0025DB4681|nr:WG repeat-containing protein [Ruminococcus sp.]MBQ8966228.1 WG repeat-containing protein [Ruminococcus sp.]